MVEGGELRSRRDELVNNKHGEVLAALVDALFRDSGVSAHDLGSIGVGLGPGPFTGLRVGVVTAAALGDALAVPVYGLCSLDTIADPAIGEPHAVVTDARRRQVYWAVYDSAGRRVEGPEISPPTELAEHLRGRVRRVLGTIDADEERWPDAKVLARHAIDSARRDEGPVPLTPMYLRRPDAREPGPPKRVTPA